MDRLLISAATFLFFLQSYLLVTNVDVYAWLHDDQVRQERANIGHMLETREKVKRKGPDSIVWEDSVGMDQLHAYDSVLTLDDSSARLRLVNDTTVDLHENTLIVLEPEDTAKDTTSTTFRVRFSRGNLLASNPDKKLDVNVEEWTVRAEAGSKMTLKTLTEGEFEIEMHKGQAAVLKASDDDKNAMKISAGTRAQLAENAEPQFLKLSDEIQFKETSPLRVYTHTDSIKQSLSWEGEPTHLRIILPDHTVTEIPITSAQNFIELPFRKGNHYLSLMDGEKSSQEIQVDVRTAPKLRYIRPLFRDRLPAGSANIFSWFPVSIARSYVVHIGDQVKIPTESANVKWNTDQTGPLDFSVWGVDADGYKIPPDYKIPVFGVQDPFSAPKPRSPASKPNNKIKKKKEKFSLWNLLIPKAYAQDTKSYEASSAQSIDPNNPAITFNWHTVEGADYYIIEISSVSDFSFPDVMTKVTEEKFMWKDYKKRTYFWRVAAGSNSGRMGLFSEPMTVDLTKAHLFPSGEIAPGVWVENKNSQPEVVKTHEPPSAETTLQVSENKNGHDPLAPEATAETKTTTQRQSRFIVNIHHYSTNFEADYSASLGGFAPLSVALEHEWQKSSDRTWLTHLRWTQMDWQPKDEMELPYQHDFSTRGAKFYLLTKTTALDYYYGLAFDHIFTFVRKDDEIVDIDLKYLAGPVISLAIEATKDIRLQLTGGFLTDGDNFGIWSTNHIRYQEKSRLFYGGDLDFSIFFGPESTSGYNSSAGFHLGLEW